jgi:hypothetical protein
MAKNGPRWFQIFKTSWLIISPAALVLNQEGRGDKCGIIVTRLSTEIPNLLCGKTIYGGASCASATLTCQSTPVRLPAWRCWRGTIWARIGPSGWPSDRFQRQCPARNSAIIFHHTQKHKKINSLNKKMASQLILNYLLCAYFVARHYSGVASQQFKEPHNLYAKQLRWALLRGALNMPIIERNVGNDATANVHT